MHLCILGLSSVGVWQVTNLSIRLHHPCLPSSHLSKILSHLVISIRHNHWKCREQEKDGSQGQPARIHQALTHEGQTRFQWGVATLTTLQTDNLLLWLLNPLVMGMHAVIPTPKQWHYSLSNEALKTSNFHSDKVNLTFWSTPVPGVEVSIGIHCKCHWNSLPLSFRHITGFLALIYHLITPRPTVN